MRPKKHRKGGGSAPPFMDRAFVEALDNSDRKGPRRENRQQLHKALQLCRQVQHALNLSLAGECGDDVLREVYVVEVTPAPDAGHLAVHVTVPRDARTADVFERLALAAARLRVHVARAITRKRAPELTFVPAVEPTNDGGEEVRP